MKSERDAYLEMLHAMPVGMVLLATAGFTAAAAGGRPPLDRLALLLLAVALTQFSISLHNDYCDRKLDGRAKPWRPIPRGLVSARRVLLWMALLAGLGLLAALPLGGRVVLLVAAGTASGYLYNAGLKGTLWSWVPFWIALPALAFCCFAVAGRLDLPLGPVFLLAAPLVLAVNLVDTLPDIETDAREGVRGVAHRLGPRGARLACWGAVALGAGMALLLWPAGRGPGPLFFLSLGLLAAAPPLDWLGARRLHWLAVMGSATALSVGWLADFAA